MKYVQYGLDKSCWHIIGLPADEDDVGTEHNYDVTFCDSIWMNDNPDGDYIETDEPKPGLHGQACYGCIAQIILLEVFPGPEVVTLNGAPCPMRFQTAWNSLGDVERQKYLQVVYEHLIRVNR